MTQENSRDLRNIYYDSAGTVGEKGHASSADVTLLTAETIFCQHEALNASLLGRKNTCGKSQDTSNPAFAADSKTTPIGQRGRRSVELRQRPSSTIKYATDNRHFVRYKSMACAMHYNSCGVIKVFVIPRRYKSRKAPCLSVRLRGSWAAGDRRGGCLHRQTFD